MGVRGLLLRRLGERSLGWKEKPSLMLSRTEGATYVKPWRVEGAPGCSARPTPLPPSPHVSPEPLGPRPHQEGLVGALAEGCVVRAVHWRLPSEAGVKLAHVVL